MELALVIFKGLPIFSLVRGTLFEDTRDNRRLGGEDLFSGEAAFPGLQIIPSGGVGIEDAPAWIAAGAMAVSLDGPLLTDAFDGGDLARLRDRARRVTGLVAEAGDAQGNQVSGVATPP